MNLLITEHLLMQLRTQYTVLEKKKIQKVKAHQRR